MGQREDVFLACRETSVAGRVLTLPVLGSVRRDALRAQLSCTGTGGRQQAQQQPSQLVTRSLHGREDSRRGSEPYRGHGCGERGGGEAAEPVPRGAILARRPGAQASRYEQ